MINFGTEEQNKQLEFTQKKEEEYQETLKKQKKEFLSQFLPLMKLFKDCVDKGFVGSVGPDYDIFYTKSFSIAGETFKMEMNNSYHFPEFKIYKAPKSKRFLFLGVSGAEEIIFRITGYCGASSSYSLNIVFIDNHVKVNMAYKEVFLQIYQELYILLESKLNDKMDSYVREGVMYNEKMEFRSK